MLTKNEITHFLLRKKRLLLILSMAVVIGLVGTLLYAFFLNDSVLKTSEETQVEKAYRQDLESLKDTLADLSGFLESNNTYSDAAEATQNAKDYATTLQRAKEPCERITERYSSEADSLSGEIADAASNARSLCSDALLVFTYAETISEALTPYYSFNENTLSGAHQLEELAQATQLSLENLQNIEKPGIEDPGRKELIVQLENTRDISTGLIGDLQRGDNKDISTVPDRVRTDKQHFLNARSYFWNNTVLLRRLEASTKRVHEEF